MSVDYCTYCGRVLVNDSEKGSVFFHGKWIANICTGEHDNSGINKASFVIGGDNK